MDANGTGDKKTLVPIHKLCEKMSPRFCKALLRSHIATGCDYLNNIGTKKAALQAKPECNLVYFGESGVLDEHQINEAESYLVKVYNSRSKSTEDFDTFDNQSVIPWRSTNSVLKLPPTSYSIREGHISRWWYTYKHLSSLLNPGEYDFLDPVDYTVALTSWILT